MIISGGNDISGSAVRYNAKAKGLFTQAGWNRIVRDAGNTAGGKWIANYGVLRWNRGYAQSSLGYTPGKAKRAELSAGGLPFYKTGIMQANFNSNSRVYVISKGGIPRIEIRFRPLGLAFSPRHLEAFKRTPPAEVAFVAREFRRACVSALMSERSARANAAAAKAKAAAARQSARRFAAAKRESRRNIRESRQRARAARQSYRSTRNAA